MKICIEINPPNGFSPDDPIIKIIEMPAVPRNGDSLILDTHTDDETEYEIDSVIWTPGDAQHDAILLVS